MEASAPTQSMTAHDSKEDLKTDVPHEIEQPPTAQTVMATLAKHLSETDSSPRAADAEAKPETAQELVQEGLDDLQSDEESSNEGPMAVGAKDNPEDTGSSLSVSERLAQLELKTKANLETLPSNPKYVREQDSQSDTSEDSDADDARHSLPQSPPGSPATPVHENSAAEPIDASPQTPEADVVVREVEIESDGESGTEFDTDSEHEIIEISDGKPHAVRIHGTASLHKDRPPSEQAIPTALALEQEPQTSSDEDSETEHEAEATSVGESISVSDRMSHHETLKPSEVVEPEATSDMKDNMQMESDEQPGQDIIPKDDASEAESERELRPQFELGTQTHGSSEDERSHLRDSDSIEVDELRSSDVPGVEAEKPLDGPSSQDAEEELPESAGIVLTSRAFEGIPIDDAPHDTVHEDDATALPHKRIDSVTLSQANMQDLAHEETEQEGTSPSEPHLPSADIPHAVALDVEQTVDAETPKIAHDSMVTVRLSEPSRLSLDVKAARNSRAHFASGPEKPGATETINEEDLEVTDPSRVSVTTVSTSSANRSIRSGISERTPNASRQGSISDADEVNWEQLEKTEGEQTRDEDTDNSTALLLARLEQENAKLATNPKSVKVQSTDSKKTLSSPRPPSMAQLRQLVNEPAPSALRYSMLPPPAMTDLEFYAALVKDYNQTAARLPTLLSNKIRKGIPPPLRGVVWQSMSGARDAALEEQYESFSGGSSPYELIIGKDLGRSFPGVDMFRETDGDGQRKLGRVLRAFSLYDTKIGYCQGLAFLVGPLLMHMPDKQAFCVLVRLMERYDMRTCFLPDLSGLHVRIYQFRELLHQNFPNLASHLEELQVDPAYVSQWFLSFFAVTCPLPMLFRIYDVIFAEGAPETLMRVALSLIRKNEDRLLACTELEDVMQLLLSRGLWDCYHYNADDFVQDFVSLTSEVTQEKLSQLEKGYRDSLQASSGALRASAISTAASRFLGRIWASSSTTAPKVATLNPKLTAPVRATSEIRRSTSKQSLASTVNSVEAISASITSSTSTEATTLSRDSGNTDEHSLSRESTPVGPKSMIGGKTTEERYLHNQIEDLLTALSELQRNHALLSNQLQREREERDEDGKAVRSLLVGLRRKGLTGAEGHESSDLPREEGDVASPSSDETNKPLDQAVTEEMQSVEDVSALLDRVETRFNDESNKHRSSIVQTKAQLRDELALAKDQLASSLAHSQDLSRRVYDMDQEMVTMRDQLRDSHSHLRTLHQDKQRLDREVRGMRNRVSSSSLAESAHRDVERDLVVPKSASGGLRELKLGRSKSIPSPPNGYINKRASSLLRNVEPEPGSPATPTSEQDGLLLELVQAKTGEATAKQEAEEAKQKLEALRRAYGLSPGDSPASTPAATPAATASSHAASTAMGMFGRLTGQMTSPVPPSEEASKKTTSGTANTASGGFWGWRR